MAKAKFTPVLEELHGQVGTVVFRRMPKGGVSVIRKADMSKVKGIPAQAAHRQRFKEAVAYARRALADPQRRKTYQKAGARKGKRAFEMTGFEYFQTMGHEFNKGK